ncbi:hypothetical protein ACZ90_00230 [Streptomyces albus subsp. albus]|nr:hypothetical protein ACZ90_00230 [Streptomyces albus subsp. albus]
MRIIVTGSHRWSDDISVYQALTMAYRERGPFVLVHGACATGADAMAHHWYTVAGQTLGVHEVRYPPDRGRYGRRAGPLRNQQMIKAGADLVLAFPLPGAAGTQGTIQLARAAGIRVKVMGHE